jgi:PAS domain S-box-containing protein
MQVRSDHERVGWLEAGSARLLGLGRALLDLGVARGQPNDLVKATHLCNAVSAVAFVIMAGWALFESWAGAAAELPLEVGLAAGFALPPVLNVFGRHQLARGTLILVANVTVFTGAVLFEKSSGGTLPFVAMVALPLLLCRPQERFLLLGGALASVALFAFCESGAAARLLGIGPRPTPSWYYAANAATAFVCAFLLPLFFYTANRRSEAALERSGREKLERLIQSSIIGVARGKLGGPILEANDALLNMIGYSRDELEARNVRLEWLTPPEYAEVSRRALSTVSERGVCPIYEKEYIRKDGSRVPVLVGMASLDATTGDTIGFVLDITAQKASEEQREQLRQSEEAIRLRDLFNSIVSHEIRTPLATVTLQAELALRMLEKVECDHGAVKKHLERCRTSASKMAAIVGALLDSARIHQGRLELSLGDVDLAETAKTVVSGLEAGGICPPGQIRVDAPTPVVGRWDPLRIDEVLTNLCSNAIKYGGGAPVELRVGAEASDQKRARIEVVDHGIGIEPSMLSRIFDPFQRARSTDHVPGLGLGLHIVRSIVEGHGGTIGVESERGRGSRFIVELPRSPVA